MKRKILITGKPKSGKSTLLEKIISNYKDKIGFITNEIKENNRKGFEIETHKKEKIILAHVDFKTNYKVSKYFVKPKNLDSIIPKISKFKEEDILYLDEIGEMQLLSKRFISLVNKYLNSENIFLATLTAAYTNKFIEQLKKRKDTLILELNENNREEIEKKIKNIIKNLQRPNNLSKNPTFSL